MPTMDHAVVQKWLRSVLGPYTDRDRVFADVDRALIAVSSLSPKTEVFTFNDGRTQLLLNLEGTIPVEFRNTTYNIPVAYWIPRGYPREPLMAFVAPTPDMAIRKGPNVDPTSWPATTSSFASIAPDHRRSFVPWHPRSTSETATTCTCTCTRPIQLARPFAGAARTSPST
ncbi:hypothetical protein NDA16_002045 [Ustilago loliicola]|nr:hypothetical protein NDA16_002045 [Ustilago loliicola]